MNQLYHLVQPAILQLANVSLFQLGWGESSASCKMAVLAQAPHVLECWHERRFQT